MAYWYISSAAYSAVPFLQANTNYNVGDIIRNKGAGVGQERCYVCITAGTSTTDNIYYPLDKGQGNGSGTTFFREATGYPGLNGDPVNTQPWQAGVDHWMGDIIKNVSGGADTYFICNYPGTTSGTEPSWNKTPGAETADGPVRWISLGPISNFTNTWAAPHARIQNADAAATWPWGVNGDTFYVADNHAEVSAFMITTFRLGAYTNPSYYLCVDRSTVPPTTLATTASMTLEGSNVVIYIGQNQTVNYIYGINIYANSNGGPGAACTISVGQRSVTLDNCTLNLRGDYNQGKIILGGDMPTSNIQLLNTPLSLSYSAQSIQIGTNYYTDVLIEGGSVTSIGSLPTIAFNLMIVAGHDAPKTLTIRDVDLSQITTSLFNAGGVDVPHGVGGQVNMQYCKLGAGVTIVNGTLVNPADTTFHVHACDSAATNYRLYTASFMGTTQQDTGIYRDGGASDGTTAVSWKMQSSATSTYIFPLQAEEIAIWNEVTGVALTATIEIAGATTLNTDEAWLEVEYLGSSGSPLGSLISTKAKYLTTGIAIPTSTASWNGSPAVKQKLSATFTPQMKGIIKARLYLAKPSTTLYIDPYIGLDNNISNRRQYLLPGFGGMNETAQGEFSYTFVS